MTIATAGDVVEFNPHTPHGGRTDVAVARRLGGAHWQVAVVDTGEGIRPDELPRLVDPIYRGSSTARSLSARGSGLGLSIMQLIVELQWKRRDREPARIGDHRDRTPADRGALLARILPVEDEDDIALALSILLRRRGHESVWVPEGREGLRAVHAGGLDLALLHIGLPDIDGWEVLAGIREVSSVPVLMLTAAGRDEDRERCLRGDRTTTSRNRSALPCCARRSTSC